TFSGQTDSGVPRTLHGCLAARPVSRWRESLARIGRWVWPGLQPVVGPGWWCSAAQKPEAQARGPEAALRRCDFSFRLPPNWGSFLGSAPSRLTRVLRDL